MPIVLLRLPKTEMNIDSRPRHCPYCGSPILQGWGKVPRTVRDKHEHTTEIPRYRCSECERTFRFYPTGVDRSEQTQRIKQLAALAWAMGLSVRDVVEVMDDLGVNLSRMTVWREGRALAERFDKQGKTGSLKRYSIDPIYIHKISTRLGVVVAIDLGDGRSVVLGTLNEHNPKIVRDWLEGLVADLEIDVSIMETSRLNQLRISVD
jgi:transposase